MIHYIHCVSGNLNTSYTNFVFRQKQNLGQIFIYIRDLFHVYLNRFEIPFLPLHIIKTNTFCFFMHKGRVPGIAE